MRLEPFVHRPGMHCGSSAFRAALSLQGLDLSEALVFGLGAGLGFSLHAGDTTLVPPQAGRLVIGRSGSFEQDLAESLGFELEMHVHASAAIALVHAGALLEEGRCVLAYTDLFHLPYLDAHGHWFGHLVALVGREKDAAGVEFLISDNERPALQTVTEDKLALALCTASPVRVGEDVTLLALSGVKPHTERSVRRLAVRAIELQAMRMSEDSEASGVIGLSRFDDEVRGWQERPDWKRCVRLAGQSMELRGNGGGFFRRLWAQFLAEAVRLGELRAADLVPFAIASADAFTALALELQRAHQLEFPRLAEAAELAKKCMSAERALWGRAEGLVAALGAQ